MACRSWPTRSTNHVLLRQFYSSIFFFFRSHLTWVPDRPVRVCIREVKGSESNTPDRSLFIYLLLLFLKFFFRGRWRLRSGAFDLQWPSDGDGSTGGKKTKKKAAVGEEDRRRVCPPHIASRALKSSRGH